MSPIDAARAVLPTWVGWIGLGLVPLYFLLALVINGVVVWVASRPEARLGPDAHWTERARLAYPPQVLSLMAPWTFGLLVLMTASDLQSPLSSLPPSMLPLLAALAALAAGLVIRIRTAQRLLCRRLSWWHRLTGPLVMLLLVYPHATVALVVALCTPPELGWGTIAVVAVGAVVLIPFLYGLPRVLSWLRLARSAPESLVALVADSGRRAGCRVLPRRVWLLDWHLANAFALPLSREMLVSERLVERLDPEEQAAIYAHELGHLDEPRWVLVMRVVSMAITFGMLSMARYIMDIHEQWGLVALGVAAYVVFLVFRPLWQRMEERADAGARRLDDEPSSLARALEKLYEANLVPAVLRSQSGPHPSLYDRLEDAGVVPEYPRPEPPPWAAAAKAALVGFVLSVGGLVSVAIGLGTADQDDEFRLLLAAGTNEECAWELGNLAWLRADARGSCASPGCWASRSREAAILWRAAAAVDEEEVLYLANSAEAWTQMGRCQEAKRDLALARHRTRLGGARPGGKKRLKQARHAVEACVEGRSGPNDR